jgi:N-acetylglucosaminyldiphosphoundecaprenol N-acetyl-beta-D-mannosaminyltransferase
METQRFGDRRHVRWIDGGVAERLAPGHGRGLGGGVHHATGRVGVLGLGVCPVSIPVVLDIMDGWIRAREPRYVCVTDVHCVMESRRDPELRRIYHEAGLVVPDGMPLVWLSRLAGHAEAARVYGPDLLLACCEHSLTHGYRHFFYGGASGVADLLAERLAQRFPGLGVAGTYSPPFRPLTPAEDAAIVELINGSRADVVWVGLGAPKQERWMHAHRRSLRASVLLGVGAAFDFHAGVKKQAPRWLQRSGFEWAFRLLTEPRRLWRRYLRNNPAFIWNIALQAAGLRTFDNAGDAAPARVFPGVFQPWPRMDR